MPISNIDTFEHDIREEIKNKEASVGDIASASGVVSNEVSQNKTAAGTSKVLIAFVVVMVVIITGAFGYLGYVYMIEKPKTQAEAAKIIDAETQKQNTEALIAQKLNTLSPTLSTGVTHFTSKVDVTPNGTTLTLSDYTSTFAFMLQNETQIAKEILAEELKKYENSTTTPSLVFSDDTKSNQNMRTLTVGSSTLVYAFIGDQYLVIANGSENILQIRSSIIK